MKEGDFIDKEYILIVLGEAYRIYHQNEKLATDRFKDACLQYMRTDNQDYKRHWMNALDAVIGGKYTIVENTDFIGVRKV